TWGKFINAGQSCVAPDYLLIHESRAADFIHHAKTIIAERYGADTAAQSENPDYCRLVSDAHQSALLQLLEESVRSGAKIEIGGNAGANNKRFIPPTLLSEVT